MSTTSERRSAPPPDGLRDLHRRLSWVLADLRFPAQRWQLIAAAEIYGCDTVTRGMLERAPEQQYHTLPELVAVLGAVLGGRPITAVPTPTTPVPTPTTPVPAPRAGAAPVRRPAPVARGHRPATATPQPAA